MRSLWLDLCSLCSPGFQRFVSVLCELTADERKAFVQFVTGCSSLPPGGLANLHPRLSVARKNETETSYPSVNTCYHYLKLPEYSSEAILRDRLLTATREKQFHFNWLGPCNAISMLYRAWLKCAYCVYVNMCWECRGFALIERWFCEIVNSSCGWIHATGVPNLKPLGGIDD